MNKLPVYKGFTVDFRLKEFRKLDWIELDNDGIKYPRIKTTSFESQKGDRLLAEMIEKDLVPKNILVDLF